jgi:hypothetical protein
MRERTRLEDESPQVRNARPIPATGEPIASTAAVFDAAGRTQEPGRGGAPAVGRAIDSLQASAGNGAISRLFDGGTASSHRDGTAQVRAGGTTTDRSVVQTSPDDEPALEDHAVTGSDPAPASTDQAPTELAAGAPPAGPSWTKVGPPSNTSYSVTGSLRDVANAVAARTEAGSVTATPSQDTETWTPDDGEEQVTAARITVKQVMELPTWTDRTKATTKQQAEWDRFHGAISTHEAGHVSKDKAAFAGVDARMVGQTPTQADAALDAAEAQAKTDNAAYDTTTNRGLNQGTGINPNIDEVTKVP